MGNFLAFASVSSTISYILEEVNRDVAGIKITTKPLDAIEAQNPVNGLNIFLYLVSPTSSVDAVDTLVRDDRGQPMNNPILSLDLHYIITATSSENDDLVAQKILASAMRILNNHPVLLRDLIRKATRNKEGLESSDLADQIDDVRLTLNALSTEDLTKIWARFPNANFRPSVAYVAQVVLLESKVVEPPGAIGSVAVDKIGQLKSPTIERIEPQILEYAPDASIVILGNGLKAPAVSVEFNDILIMQLKPENISDRRIVVPIPNEIEPGILKLAINHYLSPSEDEQTIGKRSVLKSNASPFILSPRILSPRQGKVSKGNELTVEFEPAVSKEKTMFVYLGDIAIPAVKGSIKANGAKVDNAKFIVPPGITPGVYLFRIVVDGAASLLVKDENPRSRTFNKSIGPFIEVTQNHIIGGCNSPDSE
jgi:hypothetical protein